MYAGADAEDGSLVFSIDNKAALLQIFNMTDGVRVRDLMLTNDHERLELSRNLWEYGIVQTV